MMPLVAEFVIVALRSRVFWHICKSEGPICWGYIFPFDLRVECKIRFAFGPGDGMVDHLCSEWTNVFEKSRLRIVFFYYFNSNFHWCSAQLETFVLSLQEDLKSMTSTRSVISRSDFLVSNFLAWTLAPH